MLSLRDTGLIVSRGEGSAPPWGGRTGPQAWVPSGTWKMPVSWFLLSLALGRNPVVVSLERLMEPQDTARCSLVSLGLWEAGKGSELEFSLCLITARVWLLSLPLSELPCLVCLVLMGEEKMERGQELVLSSGKGLGWGFQEGDRQGMGAVKLGKVLELN